MLPLLAVLALQFATLDAQGGRKLPNDTTRLISQYKLERWTDADGLPQNSLGAIAQTPDRFIWLASEEGLIRFDGNRFIVFNHTNTPALARSQMLALAPAPDSTLWIGTAGSGLVSYRADKFTAYTKRQGLPTEYIQAVAVDSAGVVWAGTSAGLVRVGLDGAVTVLDVKNGLPDNEVTSITADREGVVWAGTKNGLVRVTDRGVQVFGRIHGLPIEYIRTLSPARRGGVWVGTNGGGVLHFDGRRFRPLDTRLAHEMVFAVAEDAGGAVWIGTNGNGLHRWKDGRLETMKESNGGSDLVWSLAHDAEGSLWVGTNGRGLLQLRHTPFAPLGVAEGLSGEVALAVLQTRNGDRWIGTAGAGLNRITPNGVITHFNARNGLAAGLILSLGELPNGDLLIGSLNGSLTRYRNGKMTDVGHGLGLRNSITAILADSDGSYWLGSSGGGLYHVVGGKPTALRVQDGLASDFVLGLHRARNGRLWVGTRQGLSRVVDGRVEPFTAANQFADLAVVAFHEPGDESVWVATQGRGIARVVNDKATFLGSSQGLCDDLVHALVDDGAGNLWLSSNKGVLRVPLQDLREYFSGTRARVRCRLYDMMEGMRSREANGGFMPASARLQNGMLMFPTMRGAIAFDPRGMEAAAPDAAAVVLESVVVGEDSIKLGGVKRLIVDGSSRNVEVRFTSPSYRATGRLRFRYTLAGFDQGWRDAGNRHVAFYTNLPPGEYAFHAQVSNEDGVWRKGQPALPIVVSPRFYETWWFLVLCIAIAVLVAWTVHRLRMANIGRKAERLLVLVEERTRAEERYRDLFENASDMVFTTDMTGRVISWNGEAERLTGHHKALAIGTPIGTILPEIGDISNLTRRDITFTQATGDPAAVEIATRVISDNGKPAGYQIIGRDVYQWRRMQVQLQEAQKMEAVGRLAGGIAHDFNNLLTVIRGNTELLANHDEPEVVEIIKATDSASALTQQLLAFSRRQVLQTRALDLNLKINNARSLLGRLIGEDIQLVTDLDPDLPRVRGDRSQIEQMIMNLVVNARDAMPHGGRIEIRTRRFDFAGNTDAASDLEIEPGEYVELRIRDNGMGMDRATQARIFEPFFTTKEPGRGTGFGLATVYGAVKQSGGDIAVNSEPGKGTQFRIYLPVAPSELSPTVPLSRTPEPSPESRSEKILLVEDEDAVRNLVKKVLQRAGFNVVAAAGGPEALRLLQENGAIDLLVTDIVMPIMSGLELAQKVRTNYPGTNILYMSGYTEDEVIRRGVLPDGEQFLAKPFTPAELVEAVVSALAMVPAAR